MPSHSNTDTGGFHRQLVRQVLTPMPPLPKLPLVYVSIDEQLADIAALDAWTDAVLEREYLYFVIRSN